MLLARLTHNQGKAAPPPQQTILPTRVVEYGATSG